MILTTIYHAGFILIYDRVQQTTYLSVEIKFNKFIAYSNNIMCL